MNAAQLRQAGFQVTRLASSFYEVVTPKQVRIEVDFNIECPDGDKWLVASHDDGYYTRTRGEAFASIAAAHAGRKEAEFEKAARLMNESGQGEHMGVTK